MEFTFMQILAMTGTVFLNQLIFIWSRTWNVKMIASNNLKGVMLSGAIIHIAWLFGITLGVVSFKEILLHFEWKFLPVIIGSLSGGLLGSYLGLLEKQRHRVGKIKFVDIIKEFIINLKSFFKS